MSESRPSLLDHLAHAALSRALSAFEPRPVKEAAVAPSALPLAPLLVDATTGNGHDSLFLARNAPPGALLLCLDVQERALATARERLAVHGLGHVPLFLARGHQELAAILAELPRADKARPLACVAFNLGWLPGGDKSLTTTAAHSLAALEAALAALAPRGCVSLHCYTGHPGGREEADALVRRVSALPPRRWRVLTVADANRAAQAENLILVERLPLKSQAASRTPLIVIS